MQKIGIGLWLAFFLTLTIGIPLHKHYCGDRLFACGPLKSTCCCDAFAEEENHCCSNETQYFSIDDDYLGSSSVKVNPGVSFAVLFHSVLYQYKPFSREVQKNLYFARGPSPGKVPIYILHNQFNFYG